VCTLILHEDFQLALFPFFRKIHTRRTVLKSTELGTPRKDLRSLLSWSSGGNFPRDNVFRFGKAIFMSLPLLPHSQSASSEFTEVGISWRVSRPKYLLGIVLESREAIAIDLSQTKWKYPPRDRSAARWGEARIEVDLCSGSSIFTSEVLKEHSGVLNFKIFRCKFIWILFAKQELNLKKFAKLRNQSERK